MMYNASQGNLGAQCTVTPKIKTRRNSTGFKSAPGQRDEKKSNRLGSLTVGRNVGGRVSNFMENEWAQDHKRNL